MLEILGNRLRHARDRAELSLEEVASRTALSLEVLQSFEAGTREPYVDEILPLAEAYHVTLDYLLGRVEGPEELVQNVNPDLVSLGRQLRAVRTTKQLDLADVAERTSIPADRLARFEAGQVEPYVDEIIPLAELYDVSLDELAGRDMGMEADSHRSRGSRGWIWKAAGITLGVLLVTGWIGFGQALLWPESQEAVGARASDGALQEALLVVLDVDEESKQRREPSARLVFLIIRDSIRAIHERSQSGPLATECQLSLSRLRGLFDGDQSAQDEDVRRIANLTVRIEDVPLLTGPDVLTDLEEQLRLGILAFRKIAAENSTVGRYVQVYLDKLRRELAQ